MIFNSSYFILIMDRLLKLQIPKREFLLIFSFFIFATSLFLLCPKESNANINFISGEGKKASYVPSGFQLNSPLPSSIKNYLPNHPIKFQMDFWANGTGTSWRDINMRITSPILESEDPEEHWGEWKQVGTRGRFNDYSRNNLPWTESPEPIITPEESGIYRVYFEIENNVTWTIGKIFTNNYVGFVDIAVVGIEIEAEIETEEQ